jgi:hypothetical protein
MKPLILDMVHHNPGEPPFRSAFLDPRHLARYGYTGQVSKHINCIATFAKLGDFFPAGSPERAWLEPFTAGIEQEIRRAKAAGLQMFYHIDLFVLPRRLVEQYRDRLCDRNGRVTVDNDFTLEVHRLLFDELFARYPELDGFVIRHGETYLHDTPHHVGNGPVAWHPPLAEPAKERDRFVRLLDFLREEICVRHGKTLIFRTWDYLPDRFHANPDYYLAVTDRVEPHPNLIFSIKHTVIDFHRAVNVNPAHGLGRHPQIVEVQCQREYEGKGAYPNYIARGVVCGFPENAEPKGLDELARDPRYRGVYAWSRGGGWYGPYISNELWCDLNAFVVAGFAAGRGTEPELFRRWANERLGLDEAATGRLRELCLLSAEGVLRGQCCEAYDRTHHGRRDPADLWMRDDRLGGWNQLKNVFGKLAELDRVEEAIAEKAQAVAIWERIVKLADGIRCRDAADTRFVRLSARYGLGVFRIAHAGWSVIAARSAASVAAYREAWREYRDLAGEQECPSLYRGVYLSLPGSPEAPGLDATVEEIAGSGSA